MYGKNYEYVGEEVPIEVWQATHGVRGSANMRCCLPQWPAVGHPVYTYASIFLGLDRSTNLALRPVFRGAGGVILSKSQEVF